MNRQDASAWFIGTTEHASTPSSGSFSMFLCESTPTVKSSYLVLVLLMLSPTLVVVDVESGRLARPRRLMTKQALHENQAHLARMIS
jgi:hypothetical protein